MKAIYCAGEQARVVIDILERNRNEDEIVLFDDEITETSVAGYKIRGGSEELQKLDPEETYCIVAHGSEPGVRRSIAKRINESGFDFFSAIDTTTTISEKSLSGEGVIINAESYVGPGATIGDFVLIDSCVSISHDCDIGTGTTIGPGVTIAGGVATGIDAYIGAGATVIDHVSIGQNAVVGAGAVVVEDVPPNTTVVGVPAEEK